MNTFYWSIGCALFVLLVAFLLSRRTRENFRSINDEKGKQMLNILTSNLNRLTDSSAHSFTGYLEPLSRRQIMQEISFEEGHKSFTENKQKITLCLRNQFGNFYDQNSLLFVALHELAHVINDELHHTEKFRNIFDALLEHAAKNGFYDPTKAFVRNYCA